MEFLFGVLVGILLCIVSYFVLRPYRKCEKGEWQSEHEGTMDKFHRIVEARREKAPAEMHVRCDLCGSVKEAECSVCHAWLCADHKIEHNPQRCAEDLAVARPDADTRHDDFNDR